MNPAIEIYWRSKELKKELDWVRQSPKGRQAKSKARINAYQELLHKKKEPLANGVAQIVIPNGQRLGDLVIEVKNISKKLGNKQLLENFDFRVPPGAIVGIVGPNGAGKTTLFKMLTGNESPDSGEIVIGDTVKLGYVDQSRDHLDH